MCQWRYGPSSPVVEWCDSEKNPTLTRFTVPPTSRPDPVGPHAFHLVQRSPNRTLPQMCTSVGKASTFQTVSIVEGENVVGLEARFAVTPADLYIEWQY